MLEEKGPIAVTVYEHSIGRGMTKNADAAVTEYKTGSQKVVNVTEKPMMQYAGLLKALISKENNILFPLSDLVLTSSGQQVLEKTFKKIEEN